MTKRDYIEIAHILNKCKRAFFSEFRRKRVIEAFCKFLKSDNERFDEDKFKKACDAVFTD